MSLAKQQTGKRPPSVHSLTGNDSRPLRDGDDANDDDVEGEESEATEETSDEDGDTTRVEFSELGEEDQRKLLEYAYDDILAASLNGVICDVRRAEVLRRSPCQICFTKRCHTHNPRPGFDILGLPLGDKETAQQKVKCDNCQGYYPAQRFAPHLEKCLGIGGRVNSRSSSRMPGNERASASPHNFTFDSDNESLASIGEKRGNPPSATKR
ncbi:uncharacterized protein EV422DRAFT_46739 [Fimicolochytrium jonesii]|uniref:uncharacterized protein n=1 Tax=Fimicolochytrium jonesii TaxID=1396493 RepID=UPI0022FF12C2|nr:uncharacterized protein EV422DRAFT_46739 [Fimicolochytrium jonesii]KAI8820946.1 hypothetical protein EV422DRAFT_46739 [Fimicolochytrium jonesii]